MLVVHYSVIAQLVNFPDYLLFNLPGLLVNLRDFHRADAKSREISS
jgi:hypothetical protein